MSRVYAWESECLLSAVFRLPPDEMKSFSNEMTFMHHASHFFGPVKFHKRYLGRQDYTWLGEYRFWVWEGNDWRVFVSNHKGTSFEVRAGLSKEQVRAAWNEYRRRMFLLQWYPGTRVFCYRESEPGTIVSVHPQYPGCYLVKMDNGEFKHECVSVCNIVEANNNEE